jgi:hypothetical protein
MSDDAADDLAPAVPTGDRTDPWQGTLSHFLAGILANGPVRLVDQALVLIETGRPAMAARILADMERQARMAMCLAYDEGYHRGLERGERNAGGEAGASRVDESR